MSRMELTTPKIAQLFLAGLLLILSYQVIHFFITPFLWAAILVFITHPIHLFLRRYVRSRILSASIMTILLTLILLLPLTLSAILLQQQLWIIIPKISQMITSGNLTVPPFLLQIPIIDHELQRLVNYINHSPDFMRSVLREWLPDHLHYGQQLLNALVANVTRISFTILSAFFLYYEGELLLKQIQKVLHVFVGERTNQYLEAIGKTTNAVLYGIGFTALAQSIMAGIGYLIISWMVPQFPNVFLLTMITFVISLVPLATPLSWGGVCVWLFMQGHATPGFILLAWGLIVVTWIDNIVRPIVISNATKIPLLVIIFGVLGGLSAFGMIGLFLGPVVLAIFLAVWREWLNYHEDRLQQTGNHPIHN